MSNPALRGGGHGENLEPLDGAFHFIHRITNEGVDKPTTGGTNQIACSGTFRMR
jgi:hypothetical protein